MGASFRLKMRDGDVRASLSASDRPRRYTGRSTGLEERESRSREESTRSDVVPSMGRGAMMARSQLTSSSVEIYQAFVLSVEVFDA